MAIPLDPRFIPAFSVETVILDKDSGAPLSGGLVYFEQDDQRGVLKAVYQITGTSPNYTFTQLPNPMTLSSIGTFEDALANPVVPYFYPYDSDGNVEYYYVRVTSSEDVPQFVREAVPYLGGSGSDSGLIDAFTNDISNPQFAEVLFDTSNGDYVYSVNAVSDEVINIAPDWDLIVTAPGAGTITVSQLKPTGSLNITTNPGTLLNITSAGLTKLHLRQRLYGSPNLWGRGYLSASFVAKSDSGTSPTLGLYYSQSDGTVTNQLLCSGVLTGNYTAYPDSFFIPTSDSNQNFPNAYVDIFFILPLSIEIDITSVMVASTGDTLMNEIQYDQTTLDMQINDLFHYYKPQLEFKPTNSLLVGWDFPLNPAQFSGSSQTITTTAAYAWDQTICESVVGNVAVIRNTVTSGFQATTANASEAFYQLQYLDGRQAQKILGTKLAVNINAFRTTAGGVCNVKVYLYRGSSSSTFPTLPTSLGTIDAAGIFTLTASNWTLIPRGNLGQASGLLSTVDTADYTTLNDIVDLKFNGWELTDSTQISDTDKFAIVVTYACPTTGTVVTINSIGLVPGEIPTRPAPQTYDEVYRECEFYYETSYMNGLTIPTANSGEGSLQFNQSYVGNAGTTNVYPTQFQFNFYTVKRTDNPSVTFYSVGSDVTEGLVQGNLYVSSSSAALVQNIILANFWTLSDFSYTGINFIPSSASAILTLGSGTATSPISAFIKFQYVADARLGLVA